MANVGFLLFLLLLKSSLSLWWSDRTYGIISIFLYLLRLVCGLLYGQFWRRYNEVLRRRYSLLFFGWNVLLISVKSIWFVTSVSFTVSLFRSCFNYLSVGESWVLKSSTIIVWRSMWVWAIVKFILWMWVPLHSGQKCSELRLPHGRFFLWWIWSVFPSSFDNFSFKFYFIGY